MTPNCPTGFEAKLCDSPLRAAAPSKLGLEESQRIPELDGFRGLAILLVVTGHTLTFTLHLVPNAGLKMGEAGVLLFFVLSGYLITGLVAR